METIWLRTGREATGAVVTESPLGGSKGRGSEGVDLKDRIELRAEWSASLVYFQLLV